MYKPKVIQKRIVLSPFREPDALRQFCTKCGVYGTVEKPHDVEFGHYDVGPIYELFHEIIWEPSLNVSCKRCGFPLGAYAPLDRSK